MHAFMFDAFKRAHHISFTGTLRVVGGCTPCRHGNLSTRLDARNQSPTCNVKLRLEKKVISCCTVSVYFFASPLLTNYLSMVELTIYLGIGDQVGGKKNKIKQKRGRFIDCKIERR